MAKTAKIETKLTGDSTGLKRTLDTSKNDVAKYARDVTERLRAIQAAAQSINIIAGVAGFVAMAKQAIHLYKDLKNWINGTGEEARRAAAEAAEAGRKLADAAKKSGFSPSEFKAISDAAAAANIPAAELEGILAKIAEKKGGIDDVAAALGTTADNIQRAADAAKGIVGGRAYAAAAEARRGEVEGEKAGRRADRGGLEQAARDLLTISDESEFQRVIADVLRAADGDEEFIRRVQSEVMRQSGGLRGAWREATGRQRDVNTVGFRLGTAFEEDQARRAAAAEEEKRAQAEALAQAKAEEASQRTAEEAKRWQAELIQQANEEKRRLAEEQAREDKIYGLNQRILTAQAKRDEDIAAVTVSAPQAINSLNSIGGLIGADPTALNAARMAAERDRAVENINKRCDEAVQALREEIEILRGE